MATQDNFIRTALRVPPDLHKQIHEAARANNRGFNAEILARLEESFSNITDETRRFGERRKLQLLASYVEWCAKGGHDPLTSAYEFARCEYLSRHGVEVDMGIDPVPGASLINPEFLDSLYSAWIVERPALFPQLADKPRQLDIFDDAPNIVRAEFETLVRSMVYKALADKPPEKT